MSSACKKCPMCNTSIVENKSKQTEAQVQPKLEERCLKCKNCSDCLKIRQTKSGSHLKITQEEVEHYKQMFMMFDKDGDGTVSTKELGAVMRSIGLYPTEEELEEMIDEADKDDSGTVDFFEFVNLMVKREN